MLMVYYGPSILNGKKELRETISGWYYALRNFAIVALLSILLYVAIRMILSTISADKAKYKMMFKDWLVALCLVFVMHYIMVGVLNISSLITNAIGTTGQNSTMVGNVRTKITTLFEEAEDEIGKWNNSGESDQKGFDMCVDALGYIAVYAAIVVFTVIFAIKYVIRAITITFLALIAPITCITYPIDKLGDGKSQAFNFWLKEFIFEVIIQPFHLLLYVVLIGASTALADSNMIYSILCFAIMIPAEKFIKQMFGIKEQIGSPLGAFASGAVASKLASATKNWGSKSGSNSKGESNSGGDDESAITPRERGTLNDYDHGTDTGDTSGDDGGNTLPSGQDDNANRDNSTQEEEQSTTPELDEPTDDNQEDLDKPKESDEDNLTDDQKALEEAAEKRQRYELYKKMKEQKMKENGQEVRHASDKYRRFVRENEPNPQTNKKDDSNANNNQDKPTPQQEQQKNTQVQRHPRPIREVSKATKFTRGVRAEAARSIRNKVGSTEGKKVAKYVGGKLLAGGTRVALSGIAGGIAGITTLAATGSLSKAAAATAAGVAVGSNVGRGITGAVSRVGKTAGRYVQAGTNAVRGEDAARKKAKSKYMQNQKERDYVRQQLQQASGGQIPSKKEEDAELEKRWAYREAGITDRNIIDGGREIAKEKESQFLDSTYTNEQKATYNSVEERLRDNSQGNVEGISYRDAYEQLEKGEITEDYFNSEFGDGAAEAAREHQQMESEVATQRSLYEKQSLFAASIASDYKAADFRDQKKMKDLQQDYVQQFIEERRAAGKPCSKEYATEVVNSAINDAARIRGVKSGANFGKPDQSSTANSGASNNSSRNNSGSRNNGGNNSRSRNNGGNNSGSRNNGGNNSGSRNNGGNNSGSRNNGRNNSNPSNGGNNPAPNNGSNDGNNDPIRNS